MLIRKAVRGKITEEYIREVATKYRHLPLGGHLGGVPNFSVSEKLDRIT